MRGIEHRVGFANPGTGTEKYLQATTLLSLVIALDFI